MYYIGAPNEAARAKTISALEAQLRYLYNKLIAGGFPAGMIGTYAMAQIMLESDWFTSNVANTDNNYSGIKYIFQPYQKATIGLPAGDGSYYAHFATFEDWIKDYKRILSLNTGGKGRPIDATNATDFIGRLYANKYFRDPKYATKYNAALRKVSEALTYGQEQNKKFKEQRSKGEDTYTYTPGTGLTSNEKFNLDRWLTTTKNWARNNPGEATITAIGLLLGISLLKKALS